MPEKTPHFYPFHLKIDQQDEYLLAYKWNQNKEGFYTRIIKANGKTKILSLHRELLGITKQTNLIVEFVNGNKNDFRRANLKILSATQAQLKKAKGKGVTQLKNGKYAAQISINGIKKYLGCFKSTNEAEFAYLKKKEEMLKTAVSHPFQN